MYIQAKHNQVAHTAENAYIELQILRDTDAELCVAAAQRASSP